MSETELQRRLRADFPTEILASRPDLTQLLLDAVAALTTAERELAEARAEVETERACHEECCRQADAADTTRREWEVRAATSYAAGRAAGLREAAGVCVELGGNALSIAWVNAADECERRIRALAPPAAECRACAAGLSADDAIHTCAMGEPAAETERTETIFGCRTCPASTPGWSDGRFASPGWGRIAHIDGPNAICPVCAADPTSLDCLREDYPDATPAAEPRDEGERMFPLMAVKGFDGAPRGVPFRLVDAHAIRCLRNHDQSPQRLAERGGLSPAELLAVLTDQHWKETIKMPAADVLSHLSAILQPNNGAVEP